ncbi:MAG: DNA polymerase III subunit beta [Desulfuromonadales bacterium]|nr:DNA polymerase III subunit beta [Desulfuromonadales bacterium]MDT8422643.1 DNA polymerase III subunit beta [Desulfuromonadales bacterium]
MEFQIEKNIFLKGLGKIQGIVEKRNTIPILANVLIEATNNGEIQLTATDLEVGMRANYPAQVEKTGKITVSAKKIYEIIKELPETILSFKSKENCWIEIKCGKAVFNIVGLAADEFPHFPTAEETKFLKIDCSKLNSLIEKTALSMSTDESKYNLNGIFFNVISEEEKYFLRLVATDGHRLSQIDHCIEQTNIDELFDGVIFPRKGITELKKITDESEDYIEIGIQDNNAVISKDKTLIVMRLVDGDFPDYKRVIPKNNMHNVVIPRNDFLHVLKRMSILTSEKSRGIKISLTLNNVNISSSNPELGESHEDLGVDYSGPEMIIGFNVRFMIDILQIQQCENIILKLNDNISPGIIVPDDNDDYLAVIMPMRL